MSIPILSDILGWLLSHRRAQVVDQRESIRTLAIEIERLADLMDDLLQVTGSDGVILVPTTKDLEFRRRRIWNRWCTILGSDGYASRDPQMQAELERCIEIAHAAPGAYIREIYLVQTALGNGHVPPDVRTRFAESAERLRNFAVGLKLSA